MRRSAKGFTLIEVTIILLVLVILSGILLPTIERFIDLARYVKVKEDLGMFATIIELWKVDNCSRFFKQNGRSPVSNQTNRVDLLISDPNVSSQPAIDPAPGPSWGTNVSFWATNYPNLTPVVVDLMENQLVLNQPMGNPSYSYPPPTTNPSSCGWRGAYITGPLGTDPWGTRYMANVAFLGTDDGGYNSRLLGAPSPAAFQQMDVFVLSAGPDKTVSTHFTVDGVIAQKDDLIALVNGGF